MAGISGAYTNYAPTSFYTVHEEDEQLVGAPTPPEPPSIPDNFDPPTQDAKDSVTTYATQAKTYLDAQLAQNLITSAQHTAYTADVTSRESDVASAATNDDLSVIAGYITNDILNPPLSPDPVSGATPADKTVAENFALATETYIQAREGKTISTDRGTDLINETLQPLRTSISGATTASELNGYITQIETVRDIPPPNLDQKNAAELLAEAQTKTTTYTDFANGLINAYSSYNTAIPSDNSSAQHWIDAASSSTNPQAVTSALTSAKASLTQAQERLDSRSGAATSILSDITDANTRLESIGSLETQVNSHPNEHTQNSALIAQMQTLINQIPVPPNLYPGFRSMVSKVSVEVGSAEEAIINTRKQYFPNNQPPAIPAGMMYFDTSYLKPAGKPLTIAQMDSYLSSLKAAGCDTLILNFLMLGDAGNLQSHNTKGSPWSDTWNDGTTEKFIAQAQAANFKVWISIGGANIQTPGYSLGGNDPKALGKNFAETAEKLKLTGIDFDLESDCTQSQSNPDFATVDQWHTFLTALQSGLSGYGGKISFTTLANPGQYGTFAYNDTTNYPFFKTFQEFNPETYDGGVQSQSGLDGHYYLNFRYFSQWAGVPGPGNPRPAAPTNYMVPAPADGVYKHMHVGFFDTPLSNKGEKGAAYIPYIEGAKNFPTPYDNGPAIADDTAINASTPGQAAAMRYISETLQNGANEFGAVYFWPDEGTAYPPNTTLPGTDFEKDFFTEYTRWNWLHNTNTQDNHNSFWETLTSWLPWNWAA